MADDDDGDDNDIGSSDNRIPGTKCQLFVIQPTVEAAAAVVVVVIVALEDKQQQTIQK